MMRWLLNPEVRQVWDTGQEAALLTAYTQVWERKRLLRELYAYWYQQVAAALHPGSILEIGAGTGNFKRWLQPRRCWTLDVLHGRFVNVQADALALPFRTGCLDNIVMIDALHHFARPFSFLAEAARVLRPGGRFIMVEPFVSAWGRFVYQYLHHERVDFDFQESDSSKPAWDGNAAIPQLVLNRIRQQPGIFNIVSVCYCEFLAYPLSGGFSYRSLLPEALLLALHRLERARCFCNEHLGLRLITVLENPS